MTGLRYVPSLLVAAAAFAQSGPFNNEAYEPLSPAEKAKLHANRMYAPSGLGKSALTAGYNHWVNDPEEWGQGWKGYGRRYGHRLLNRGVENALGLAISTTLGEDPRYFYSGEQGVWRRVRYAVRNTFLTRTDNGGRRFSTWRFVGNYGAGFISNTWRPPSENRVHDALARGSISIGYDVAANIFKEFWPDIKRKIRGR
jgi:hypothetical protein